MKNLENIRAMPRMLRDQLWQKWRRTVQPAWLQLILHRTSPVSTEWGHDRGSPVDRYYIESFLQKHRRDMHGRILEIRDSTYTEKFGENITRHDVLDLDAKNPDATFICDLANAKCVPSEVIDCFVCTQTLQFVFEPRAAIAEIHRFLKPGGVVLATMPGISRVDRALADKDYWRFSVASGEKLFGDCFGANNVSVRGYGNALTAMGFLTGMARQEFKLRVLEAHDKYFPVIVAVRAVKQSQGTK